MYYRWQSNSSLIKTGNDEIPGCNGKEKVERSRKQQQTKGPPDKEYHGKQSMKKLAQQNVQLSNIEITNNNIKAFEKVAKKYGIDFSLKRDKSVDPPRYFVFLKQGTWM